MSSSSRRRRSGARREMEIHIRIARTLTRTSDRGSMFAHR